MDVTVWTVSISVVYHSHIDKLTASPLTSRVTRGRWTWLVLMLMVFCRCRFCKLWVCFLNRLSPVPAIIHHMSLVVLLVIDCEYANTKTTRWCLVWRWFDDNTVVFKQLMLETTNSFSIRHARSSTPRPLWIADEQLCCHRVFLLSRAFEPAVALTLLKCLLVFNFPRAW